MIVIRTFVDVGSSLQGSERAMWDETQLWVDRILTLFPSSSVYSVQRRPSGRDLKIRDSFAADVSLSQRNIPKEPLSLPCEGDKLFLPQHAYTNRQSAYVG